MDSHRLKHRRCREIFVGVKATDIAEDNETDRSCFAKHLDKMILLLRKEKSWSQAGIIVWGDKDTF